ncbi:surface antigen 2 (CA-2), partial [Trypanosoma grayi]|uniref:surface antigen 2 (CA-2) n=1 Tax=Trypanosoma grayi TaxID=71804 RepID=UPI0004F42ADA
MQSYPTRLDAICEEVHGDFTSSGVSSVQLLCQQIRRLRINAHRLTTEQIPSLGVDITALQEPHLRSLQQTNMDVGIDECKPTAANVILGAESLFSHCKKLSTDVTRGLHRVAGKEHYPINLFAIGYTPQYYKKQHPSYKAIQTTQQAIQPQRLQTPPPSGYTADEQLSVQQVLTQETTDIVPSTKKNEKSAPFGQQAGGDKPAPFGQSAGGDKPAPFGQPAGGDKPALFGQPAGGDKPALFGQPAGGDKPAPFGQQAGGDKPS